MQASLITIETIIDDFTGILELLFPVLFAIPIALFLWGVIKFIYAAQSGDDQKLQEGRKYIVWGVIALAVVLGIWGFVALVTDLVCIGNCPVNPPPIPVL